MNDKYKSILVIVIGFLLLGRYFRNDYLFYAALGLGVLTLLSERIADGVLYLWMGLAKVLGWISSRVILSVVFFLFLTPLAFLARIISGRDAMGRSNKNATVFKERNHRYQREDLENVW